MEHTIKTGSFTVCLTTAGGSLTSIKKDGVEYLWQGDPDVWSGQAPICFPVCGGLRDDCAETLSGKTIALARHGFARKQEFELIEAGETDAAMRLRDTPELRAGYPFPFELVARYHVAKDTLSVTYEVTNTGDEDMPFFIGGHPAFCCPIEEGASFDEYCVEFECEEEGSVPRSVPSTGLIDVEDRLEAPQHGRTLALSHELFAVSETIYDTLRSRSVTLSRAGGGHGLSITFPNLPYLIVWSKPFGDFVALEPWSGLSTCSDEDNIFEHKRGCLTAHPGETVTRGFGIAVW